jgi:hypothetical protein
MLKEGSEGGTVVHGHVMLAQADRTKLELNEKMKEVPEDDRMSVLMGLVLGVIGSGKNEHEARLIASGICAVIEFCAVSGPVKDWIEGQLGTAATRH